VTTHQSATQIDVFRKSDERRTVSLDGVHNFRDLGGYPADGGVTRWERVYRADGLQLLTREDLAELRRRGLGMVIDLRSAQEVADRGTFPTEQHAVAFHHLPVIDKTWQQMEIPDFDDDVEFLMWAYRDMLRVGANEFAAALTLIASAGSTPLVFHCAAGKDRTGLLAALLLSILGVPDEHIAADYSLTAVGMERLRAWATAQSPEGAAAIAGAPSRYFASPPEVMVALLSELREDHGSVVNFVRSIGASEDTINSLRTQLIDTGA
jgi:protein-tyrosine phosphatase